MVAQFYNRTLDQRSIVDVSRTTPSNGTFSEDIVRAALFSNISSAASRHFFPDNAPLHGWSTSYSLGFAGFGYRNSSTCWLDSLKNVIAAGFPVIVLQWYSDLASDGGHFRVVTGYDDTAGVIITNDPWDRDGQAPVMKYSDQEFCKLWNYTEVDDQGRTYAPYFAQLMMPWPMTVQVFKNPEDPAAVIVHVEAVYPCVEPFCATAPNATDVVLTVTINGDVIFTAPLGDWEPGHTQSYSWPMVHHTAGATVEAVVTGFVSGQLPRVFCCGPDSWYPAYHYRDQIGGRGIAHMT